MVSTPLPTTTTLMTGFLQSVEGQPSPALCDPAFAWDSSNTCGYNGSRKYPPLFSHLVYLKAKFNRRKDGISLALLPF